MNKKINLEFILGLFILFFTILLFINLSTKISFFKSPNTFMLESSFFDIGSLKVGSDVKIKGVEVGVVNEILLNPESFMAIVKTSYQNKINIPTDSSFKISNNGFIGSPYIEISLGSSSDFLNNNDETLNNIDAISLEKIINNFIFN